MGRYSLFRGSVSYNKLGREWVQILKLRSYIYYNGSADNPNAFLECTSHWVDLSGLNPKK